MKKYFTKLDKKFKLNERLGFSYDDHGASSGKLPPGFPGTTDPQPQQQYQQPQQQYQQPQQQYEQHHQQYQPPPQQQQLHTASPPQAQFPPPPPGPPPPPQAQAQARMGPPTVCEINRYRTHHGTNIGSVFVLERWLFPGMFLDSAEGGSELSAVSAWVGAHGIESARAKWEEVSASHGHHHSLLPPVLR